MTIEEYNLLKVGDVVYYYRTINPMRLSTINAALDKKVISTIYEREDGTRAIGLASGGIILKSLLPLFDMNKDKLLHDKIKDIKKKVFDAVYGDHPLRVFPNGLMQKYQKLLEQKNLQPMLEKYPELLI
jgi:hypothetical protein